MNLWDILISISQFTFYIANIINLRKQCYIPRVSSGLTFTGLFVIAFSMFQLQLFWSTLTSALSGTFWLLLYVFRGKRT